MATGVASWSRTAASNGNSDSGVNMAEGQAPSTLNDGGRGVMASVAMFRDDISGAIATGGTSTAYTVASYQGFASLAALSGQMIAFTPHTTNGATVTLSVDGLTAKPLRSAPSVELPSGVLVQGTPYVALYNNSDAVWYLQNYHVNPYVVPIGGMIDWWGASVPNSSFAFPTGQQISQSTYATLYALFGSNKFGTDGGGLFYMPNVAGRVTAMKEASATLLTTAGGGVDGATLGATGGAQNVTLATAQIPALSITSVSVNSASSGVVTGTIANSNFTFGNGGSTQAGTLIGVGGATGPQTSTGTGAYANASQTATKTVMPTIIVNKIMRII